MGYSRTPKSVEKVKPLLDEMLESKEDIEWSFLKPSKVSYDIREAIRFSIVSKKEELKKYASLANKYKIRIIEPGIVKCELRDTVKVTSPAGMIIRGINDVIEIIGAVLQYKKPKLIFLDFKRKQMEEIEKEDLAILTEWCKNNSYGWYFDDSKLIVEKQS